MAGRRECHALRVRTLLVLASLLVITGCSASGGQAGSASSPQPAPASATAPASTTPAAAPSTAPSADAAGADPCDLLTAEELAVLGATEGMTAKPGLTGGIPNCQWPFPDGRFIQLVATSASEWARSLPEVMRMLDQSGIIVDQEQKDRLKAGQELVERGGRLDPDEACDLFSLMLELRGGPPGQQHTVNIIPSPEDPQAVTAQMCSGGRFTSVMIASSQGLAEPLPGQQVVDVVQAVHRRTLA